MVRSRRYMTAFVHPAPVIGWGAVAGGAAIGAAGLLTLGVLWLAVASDIASFASLLPWFEAASALVALFVAAWLAAWFSEAGTTLTGLAHGLIVWGVFALASTVIAAPAVIRVSGFEFTPFGATPALIVSDPALWATVWSLIIGAAAASAGGVIAARGRARNTVAADGSDGERPGADAPTHAADAGMPADPMRSGRSHRGTHLVDP